MEQSTNLVLYDWLSITFKALSTSDVVDLIGMSGVSWEITKGAHGYQDRMYYNSISIHFNGRSDMGVWLEMSGQGCRCFETVGHGDYQMLFDYVRSHNDLSHITRLDVAYDDHTGILPIQQICSDTLDGNFVSKAQYWEVIQSSKGSCVVIGSAQSAVLIRIYDKARERHCDPGTHWIRVELQLRDDRAYEFLDLDYDIGKSFAGVLLNYLRYVVPDENDSNKWRWPITDYWADLVGDVCCISIYTSPGLEYNVLRCENFVFNQAGNAISALLQCYDFETFLQKLEKRTSRPNPKYAAMVKEFKNG